MARSRFLDDLFGPPPEPKTAHARLALETGDYTCENDGQQPAAFVEYGRHAGHMLCMPCLLAPPVAEEQR